MILSKKAQANFLVVGNQSAIRLIKAGENSEQRGFTGSVSRYQCNFLSFCNAETEVAEEILNTKRFTDILYTEVIHGAANIDACLV